MAQSVEHVIGNDEVISSILITSSKIHRKSGGFFVIKMYGSVGRARHGNDDLRSLRSLCEIASQMSGHQFDSDYQLQNPSQKRWIFCFNNINSHTLISLKNKGMQAPLDKGKHKVLYIFAACGIIILSQDTNAL